MNIDRNKILKMTVILALICVVVGSLTRVAKKNSMTLEDYAKQNPELAYQVKGSEQQTQDSSQAKAEDSQPEASQTDASETGLPQDASGSEPEPASSLTGASLNRDIPEEERTLYTEGFYYEPLSDNLQRYITGISYPVVQEGAGEAPLSITYEELRYVHIWHYDFNGEPAEGELICNQAIAQDLVEIFYELYRNEYQIEKVLLIDEYDGDDTASMEDNNTSCFNYRLVEGSTSLSKHALGLAIDINPLYNPYITYNQDGSQKVSPVSAQAYSDRSLSFPYKIDENDLCYRLFVEHGFTWGGNWNSSKDYQHFQKTPK